ncbi:MAG: hypothetical protein GF311_05765 [Candidatus Lokiarchaeota archaeon]|nr:hypothetical protein [Candidatus Lokiarchaeota archaeon]
MVNSENWSLKVLEEPKIILKYLQIGTNLPIWKSLEKYILHDLIFFKAKLILLQERGYPCGVSLIFESNSTLYFGYFKVVNHDDSKIEFLIKKIIEYARNSNIKVVKGPINVPIIIYGWGFMEANSKSNLCATKPVNPPFYIEIFLKNNFQITSREITYEKSPVPYIDPWKLNKYNYAEYKFFNPANKKEFQKYKQDYIKLHAENLPISSRITPNSPKLINNYLDYIFEFGYKSMIIFIKHKPTNEIVASGTFLPEPFRIFPNGKTDCFCIYSWVIDKNYRGKGLAILLYGGSIIQLWKKGVKNAFASTGENNMSVDIIEKVFGGVRTKSHVLLEKKIN